MTHDYSVVITTTANAEQATSLAKALVTEKLAACVQVQAITSYYVWKGETCSEPECLLLVKTRSDLFPRLDAFIRANHTYENPEIIQLPVTAGSTAYLRWIDEVTGA